MDLKLLEKIGLTESEIRVYFALLRLGSASTGPIISEARVNHSKIYLILKKLQDKGLVSHVISNGIKYFQSTDPVNLIQFLSKKKRQIERQEKELEKMLPELRLQQQMAKQKQEAVVYTGREGIKAAFNLILLSLGYGEEYYVITFHEEAESKWLRNFLIQHHKRRIKKKIKVKLLTMKRLEEKIKRTYPMYPLSERRFIDIKLPTGLIIFKGYVAHFIMSDNSTVFMINSTQNSERYKDFFMELWRRAKK